MKKIILFLCVFLFSFPVYAKDIQILGIGDSITTGYGAEEGYFDIVCKEMENELRQKVHCTNMAVDGLTSSGLLSKLKKGEFKNQIENADYIFMSIGGNDFLKEMKKNMTSYMTTDGTGNIKKTGSSLIKNMSSIYEYIGDRNPSVKVSVVPLYNPYYQILARNKKMIIEFKSIQKRYMDTTVSYSNIFLPNALGDQLEDNRYLNVSLPNIDPHPNGEGHKLIAKEIIAEMTVPTIGPVQKESKNFLFIGTCIFSLMCITVLFLLYKKRIRISR